MVNGKPREVEAISPELLELVSPEMDTWLNSLSAEVLTRYGGQYIAVRNKEIVAADDSLGRLFKKLDRMELTYRVRYLYIEEPDAWVILRSLPKVGEAMGRRSVHNPAGHIPAESLCHQGTGTPRGLFRT